MKSTISILGCGWLGFPLALELTKEGYSVKGSSRSEQRLHMMDKKGIQPFFISFDPLGKGARMDQFFSSDVVIIAIPPSTSIKPSYFHPNQIMNIMDHMIRGNVKTCVYVSSTVVYPDNNGMVDEDTKVMANSNRSFAVVQAERILKNSPIPITIIRCGGLMGYERNPINYLSYLLKEDVKTKSRKSADTPVNYVHRDDVIEIVSKVLKKKIYNQIINAVAPEHPLRRNIINAKYPDSTVVETNELDTSYKIVDSSKSQSLLDFQYKHPNPLEFPYATYV